MRNESETPMADTPFTIPVADRLKRLPPYLFGRINKLKYQKRQQGVDVIDLGMGNPTDAPDPLIIEKMKEALLDPKNHRYSVANGIENLRKEVSARYFRKYGVRLNPENEVIACLGSKEGFSHMCLALMGPGDTAIVPAPTFPIPRLFGDARLGECDRPRCSRALQIPRKHRLHLRASLPEAEARGRQLPAIIRRGSASGRTSTTSSSAWRRSTSSSSSAILRTPTSATTATRPRVSSPAPARSTSASKRRPCRRASAWPAGGSASASATAKWFAPSRPSRVTTTTASSRRFRSPRSSRCAIANRLSKRSPSEYQDRRDVLVEGLNRIGWDVEKPKAGNVRLGEDSRTVGTDGVH